MLIISKVNSFDLFSRKQKKKGRWWWGWGDKTKEEEEDLIGRRARSSVFGRRKRRRKEARRLKKTQAIRGVCQSRLRRLPGRKKSRFRPGSGGFVGGERDTWSPVSVFSFGAAGVAEEAKPHRRRHRSF